MVHDWIFLAVWMLYAYFYLMLTITSPKEKALLILFFLLEMKSGKKEFDVVANLCK